jgi:hypothetical protein
MIFINLLDLDRVHHVAIEGKAGPFSYLEYHYNYLWIEQGIIKSKYDRGLLLDFQLRS